MLIYLQMEPKWSQNKIKSIQTNSTHSDHETSIFQHSRPTVSSMRVITTPLFLDINRYDNFSQNTNLC